MQGQGDEMTEVEVLQSRIETLAAVVDAQGQTIRVMLETQQRVLHCLSLLRDTVYGEDIDQ